MIEAQGVPGSDVQFDGKNIILTENSTTDNHVSGGSFDNVNGVLTLTFANGDSVSVSGFLTQGDIGDAAQGLQGPVGPAGADGLVGVAGPQGPQGCQGPPGQQPGGQHRHLRRAGTAAAGK